MDKKSFKQFLEEIIKPIESLSVDNGTLFVFFEAFPKFNPEENPRFYSNLDYEEAENINFYFGYGKTFTFSLPYGNTPGKWQSAPQDESVTRKEAFTLRTLSGILRYGGKGGYLFEAEGRGEIRKLRFDNFVYIPTPYEKLDIYQQAKLDVEKEWYDNLNLGNTASEARLIRKVKNLNPYSLWQFSIASVKRQISLRINNNLSVPDIYKEALILFSAKSKYECNMGDSEIEEIINYNSNSEKFGALYSQKLDDLLKRLNDTIEKDIASMYIGKAIANLRRPDTPFLSLKELSGQHTLQFWNLYKDEYDLPWFPNLLNSENIDNHKIFHRILFATVKQELDWQVSDLQRLLGY